MITLLAWIGLVFLGFGTLALIAWVIFVSQGSLYPGPPERISPPDDSGDQSVPYSEVEYYD